MKGRTNELNFNIPPMVQGKAQLAGELGSRWLENLDRIVKELERQWKLRVTEVLNGGSHALVCRAVGEKEREYVLKIEIPDTDETEFLRAIQVLEAAQGKGYVTMYAYDVEKRAIMFESLGKTLKSFDFSVEKQMEILCKALNQTWKLSVKQGNLPGGHDCIEWFRDFIPATWETLQRLCSEAVVKQALMILDERQKNMKPDEYEEAPIQKARERSQFLGKLTGSDGKAIWQWGFLQMVSTALILLQIRETQLGQQMLRIAEVWCGQIN